MTEPPRNPKIYHITHLDNLHSILKFGKIFSDVEKETRKLSPSSIGMNHIKTRRSKTLEVKCYANTTVGEYVPFYFCPRSVMLYLIYRKNHPELIYTGGQNKIIHIEADLNTVIDWAKHNKINWAFTDVNAGAKYAEFYNDKGDLSKINWQAVNANDWKNDRDSKQAEFLLQREFPIALATRIGVISNDMKNKVLSLTKSSDYSIEVCDKKDWYY